MYFSVDDDDLLEKYNTIWDKISADIKEEFLIASLSIMNLKKYNKQKKNLMDMKLKVYTIKSSLT